MFRRGRYRLHTRNPAPVHPALEMALTVRLDIFSRAEIRPAAEACLAEFGKRLDQVRSHRHSVDFETAKALAWWEGPETDRLVALGTRTVGQDGEIQKLRTAHRLEAIIFERHLEERLKERIRTRGKDMRLQLIALRDNRLNLQ